MSALGLQCRFRDARANVGLSIDSGRNTALLRTVETGDASQHEAWQEERQASHAAEDADIADERNAASLALSATIIDSRSHGQKARRIDRSSFTTRTRLRSARCFQPCVRAPRALMPVRRRHSGRLQKFYENGK